mgnify:CR=1 FL=1
MFYNGRHQLGCLRARRGRPRDRYGAAGRRARRRDSALSAAWWCWTPLPTSKSQGTIPASAEMLPIPKNADDPGIVTADDVQGMMKAEGLSRICNPEIASLCTPARATPGATAVTSR